MRKNILQNPLVIFSRKNRTHFFPSRSKSAYENEGRYRKGKRESEDRDTNIKETFPHLSLFASNVGATLGGLDLRWLFRRMLCLLQQGSLKDVIGKL